MDGVIKDFNVSILYQSAQRKRDGTYLERRSDPKWLVEGRGLVRRLMVLSDLEEN
jgi:hypothetical protein